MSAVAVTQAGDFEEAKEQQQCECKIQKEEAKEEVQKAETEETLLPKGFRVCPSCKELIEITNGCSSVHCRCGANMCYYCGAGPFNDSGSCYEHLKKEHDGYFNLPPDYRKFMRGENVPDEELDAFYAKYPALKNYKI